MGVVLKGPNGETAEVSIEEAAPLLDRGWVAETGDQRAGRISDVAKEEQYGGAAGAINTALVRGTGALTGGLSDVILTQLGGEDSARGLKAMEEVNPEAAIVGEIGGALLGGSKAAAFTPAGQASKIGTRIANTADDASRLAKVGGAVGGAAFEGAAQNAGAYITDVALGDKELAADSFVGAMGKGALFGGVAGGALSSSSGALTAARKLFPKTEMTAANVARVNREAIDNVTASLDETAQLGASAREVLAARRAAKATVDPVFAAKLDEIKAANQRTIFAKAESAEARAVTAEARAAKAKAAAGRATGGAKKGTPQVADDIPEEGVVASVNPKDLDGREWTTTPGVGDDVVKMDKARAAMKEGQRDPVTIAVSPKGKLDIVDGRHRFAAAKEAGVPVKVRWDRGSAGMDGAGDDLLGQLQATKGRIDGGATLGDLNTERALNRALAEADPQSARLVAALDEVDDSAAALQGWLGKYGKKSEVAKLDRKMATEDWVAGRRNQGEGWQTKVPEGEGNSVIRRGREMEWRGSEEGRLRAEQRIIDKVPPAEREAADAAVAKLWSGKRAEGIADDVVDAAPRPDVDSALETALKSRVDDIDDDIADAATTIGRHEASHAGLADELGEMTPPSARARADAFREAQRSAEGRATQAAADTAGDLDKALATASLPGSQGAARSALGSATDAATAWEALNMLGIPMPDPKDIPVVGPVLSAFLKARVLGKSFGRFGGKVAETAESTIASKSAELQQRAYVAIDKLLDAGSKGLARAAPKSGGVSAAIGHVLFSDRADGKPYSSEPAKGDVSKMFAARADELVASQRPGAIREAVRSRVRVSDPAILDAIVASEERKLGYLYDKMPKASVPTLLTGRAWEPARFELAKWAERVEAADDPASVLEAAARGDVVSAEAAETLRTVYPRLFAEAQKRLVQGASEPDKRLPYKRRLQLSALFDLPLDPSLSPEYASFLQAGYQPAPISQGAPPPQPGQPTINGPVNLGAPADPYAR